MSKLYQKRDPKGFFGVDIREIGKEVGLPEKAIKEIISFLESEDFARFQIKPHYVKLTNAGIEFVEKMY